MHIEYKVNGNLLCIGRQMEVTPKVGDKVEIKGMLYKVKDIIWHITEFGAWIEVFL